MIKITHYFSVLAFLLLMGGQVYGQSALSISQLGVAGLPDTVRYGDTLRNMTVTVINDGPLPVINQLITAESIFNGTGGVVTLGSLQIPNSNPLPVGDSIVIPLDDFVVSPQNSNNGSNIVVIWPTSPGTQPSDSVQDDYFVEDTPNSIDEGQLGSAVLLYPNPCHNRLIVQTTDLNQRIASLSIYNLQGKLVYSEAWPAESIDTGSFRPGSYFIEFKDMHQRVYRKRFTKQ